MKINLFDLVSIFELVFKLNECLRRAGWLSEDSLFSSVISWMIVLDLFNKISFFHENKYIFSNKIK